MMKVIMFLVVLLSVAFANNNPIVGILTQPSDNSPTQSYIAASYVKFIEGAGARAVPIFHNSTQEQLKSIFNSVNGILFPGGGSDISENSPLLKSAAYLYGLALQAYDNGDYFPIQGHCQGFQILMELTSRNFSILEKKEAENISMPLIFYNGFQNSRFFSAASPDIIELFTTPITLNNHHYGVSPDSFQANPYLRDFYHVLSHNYDIYGQDFISTAEGVKYPIYALQWHAEKPLYEWNNWEAINHSTSAILAMQYTANFFVSEARKNNHSFPSEDEESAALIYNYTPVFTGKDGSGDFVQTYYF